MTWLLVAAGGLVGAPLRYLVDRAVQARHDSVLPWGTLTVNAVGCLVLGLLAGAVASRDVELALGIGLCGALTTYSTFSYETLRLVEGRAAAFAGLNVVANVVGGLAAVYAGLAIGTWLAG